MIDKIRLTRFLSEYNCYKCPESGCPLIRELATEIAELQEKLRQAEYFGNIQEKENLRNKDKLHRRNLQIADLTKKNQKMYDLLVEATEWASEVISDPNDSPTMTRVMKEFDKLNG